MSPVQHVAPWSVLDSLRAVDLASDVLQFTARGNPKGQGSVHALPSRGAQRQGKRLKACTFDEVVLTSDSKDLKQWRAVVRSEARCAFIKMAQASVRRQVPNNPLRDAMWPAGPVSLVLIFLLPRSKRCAATSRFPHVTRPDLDKLVRAVKDALTGVLYADDGQVQLLLAQKFIAAPDEAAGVEVTAWQ